MSNNPSSNNLNSFNSAVSTESIYERPNFKRREKGLEDKNNKIRKAQEFNNFDMFMIKFLSGVNNCIDDLEHME